MRTFYLIACLIFVSLSLVNSENEVENSNKSESNLIKNRFRLNVCNVFFL